MGVELLSKDNKKRDFLYNSYLWKDNNKTLDQNNILLCTLKVGACMFLNPLVK
jgi:hypothetical protein